MNDWRQDHAKADYWEKDNGSQNRVICKLSPRNCKILPGKMGKCGVRGNVDGELRTFNFGKSVEATMEIIETEAVYHFMPGAKILSLGNIGCMMSCDFCQNWKTSQVRHLEQRDIRLYTPSEVIETCKQTGIDVISWTYNDPVVWHEFVVETSKMAQKEGIKTLYKSAFYIEEEPVKELIDCIDIFSISLKSMDETFYRKFTGGTYLKPVLDRIKQVNESGRHLEVSQLLITGRNDNEEEIAKTNQWVLDHLKDTVPLHYVGFHPAYLYMDTTRTSEDILLQAQKMAYDAGIKYCYVGNTFKEGVADTHCPECGYKLVSRYGLDARVVGITADNKCQKCKASTVIVDPHYNSHCKTNLISELNMQSKLEKTFYWNSEVQSVHIEISKNSNKANDIYIKPLRNNAKGEYRRYVTGGVLKRIIVSRQEEDEQGIVIATSNDIELNIFPVLDRAHFPVSTELSKELKGYRELKADQIIETD